MISEKARKKYAEDPTRGANPDVIAAKADPTINQRYQQIAEKHRTVQKQTQQPRTNGNYQRHMAERQKSGENSFRQGKYVFTPGKVPIGPAVFDETKEAQARAIAAHRDYLNSEEYRQKRQQADLVHRQAQFSAGMELPRIVQDEKEQALKARADYWTAKAQAEDSQAVTEKNLAELSGWSTEDQQTLREYVNGQDVDFYNGLQGIHAAQNRAALDKLERQEALFQKYGRQRVEELAETYKRQRNAQTAEEVTRQAQESAGKGFWAGAGHSVGSVGANLLSGPAAVMDYMRELGQRTGQYKTLDPNAAGNLGNVYSGAVRETVTKNIEKALPGMAGKAASIAYQGGMSAVDSLARVAAFGGAGSLGMAAVNTFGQTLSDASKQGATPGQAVALATANAAIETLSEKIPLDNLLATAKGGRQTAMEIVKTALAQAGIEATTEEVSYVGELLAEAAILREKSGYRQQIGDLVANGASYAEAKAQADKAVWDQAVHTAVVSAASGGLSSGAASLFANAVTPKAEGGGQSAVAPMDVENAGASPSPQPEASAIVGGNPTMQPQESVPGSAPVGANIARPQSPAQRQNPVIASQSAIHYGMIAPGNHNNLDSLRDAPLAGNPTTQTETVPQGTPGGILTTAVEKVKAGGKVSNSVAEAVLSDPAARQALAEQTGRDISGAKAEQRDQVKAAIEQIAREAQANTLLQDILPSEQPTGDSQQVRQSFMDGAQEIGRQAPDNQGMIATGNHNEFDSLRGAPPLPSQTEEIDPANRWGIEETLGLEHSQTEVDTGAKERGLRYKASKVNSAILDLVDRVKRGLTKGSEKIQLGIVSDSNAAQIQRETGIDVRGYNVAIEARQIDHILKDHGENGASNHTMANDADIARMEYVLSDPDSIQKAGRTFAYVTNSNGRQRRADTVLYAKDIGDNNYYVVQAVPETKNRTLYVVSAFIGGKEYVNEIGTQGRASGNHQSAPQMPIQEDTHSTNAIDPSATPKAESVVTSVEAPQSTDINAPGATSKTEDTVSSMNSIPQTAPEVNENPVPESDYYDEFEGWGADPNRDGVEDPMADRSYSEVGKRSVKAYMYDNPAVKPFYQEQAAWLMSELADSTKGERTYNDQMYYESGGEQGWSGTKRHTSESIAELLDQDGMTYDEIARGLSAIINDHGQENNAASKRIEFVINDRLMNGYTDFYTGERVPGNAEYLDLLRNQQSPPSADIQKPSTEGGQPGQNGVEVMGADDGGHGAVGAAEQNFTGTADYDQLLSDQNAQRDRPNDVRPVEVPKVDAQGKRVSEFVGNAYGSALTKDNFIPTIKKLTMEGQLSHEVQTNSKSLELAAQDIAVDGIETSVLNIRDTASKGKTSANDVAKATLLYNYLLESEDARSQELAADVFVSLSQLATNSGRSTQLFSMFRKMTPDGQMMTIQKEITQYTQRLKRLGLVPKEYAPQTASALFQQFRDAAQEYRDSKTPEDQASAQKRMKAAQDAIYLDTAAQMPATFKAKWDAWRYMCMLGNVKTQVRNMAGNAAMMPYVKVKNLMATGAERIFIRDKGKRTKAILSFSQEDQALRAWAKADAKSEDVHNALKYSAKLGDDTTIDQINENRQIFKTKALDDVRKFVEKIPGEGDLLFKNGYYADHLAGFLKARGYTAADIESGRVNAAILDEGRTYAIQEAMRNTFNDCNSFSDFVAGLRFKDADNGWKKAANILGEGVMPFRRTPANIVVRFAEYSPAGVLKTVWDAATKVKSGQFTAAAAIDQIASSMTGTAAMGLGWLLASGIAGVKLTGSGADDDEKRQGHQDYALEFSVGGKEYSYTIDWAAPANLPLFLGANLHDLVKNGGGNTEFSAFTKFIYSMRNMFEPMLSLSCLSSLNDLFETGRYAGEWEALYSVLAQAATIYFTQGIPSLVRQTAQAFQENKQQTFANSADPLLRDMERKAAGIPFLGAAFQTDKVDAWGETESRGNVFKRDFDAYFNPGTIKQIDNGPLEREVTRLNESQPDSVSPPDTAKTISYTDANGERHSNRRLTEEEYNTLATVQGQTAKSILDGIIESDSYKALTDEQKAKVFDYVYDYAREKGRTEAIQGYDGLDGWMKDIQGQEQKVIMDKVITAGFSDAFDGLTDAWSRGDDGSDAVDSLEQTYRVYDGMEEADKQAFQAGNGGRVGYFLTAKEKGVDTGTFADLYRDYRDIDGNEDLEIKQKAQAWAKRLAQAQDAGAITGAQKDALKEKMVFRYNQVAKTEKFDQMQESGIETEDADQVIHLLDGIIGTGAVDKETGEPKILDIDKYGAIAGADFLDSSEKDAVMKAYMPDYDPTSSSPKTTELKYDAIRDMGISSKGYVETYGIFLEEKDKGGGKLKDRIVNRYMEDFGCSRSVATEIYKIYDGKYKPWEE